MKYPGRNIGQRFQEETKYSRPLSALPVLPVQERGKNIVPLPKPEMEEGPNLWEVLSRRRSIRQYGGNPLSLGNLSHLLWAAQGLTAGTGSPWYRTSPSAGALHPIDTYVMALRVEGLEPGIYFLRVSDFALDGRSRGEFGATMARAALDQSAIRTAAAVFIWAAVIDRSREKYRERAYRYIYLDCGHICQNVYLAATAMGLGCCGIGAFFDDEVNALIGVDGHEETAIYLATVGKEKMKGCAKLF